MKLKVVDARTIDFTPYGKLFNLRAEGEGLCYSCAADYTGSYTAAPVIDTLGSLGYTKSAGLPFTAEQMERHGHTQEAQIPESQPIVFLVAPATDAPRPNAKDVKAVMIPKGYVAALPISAPRTGCIQKAITIGWRMYTRANRRNGSPLRGAQLR